jgi:hypothetical protein
MTAHTEEFLEEQQRVEAETDKFIADSRTIRFQTTNSNFTALADFLDQHGLEVNHRNLLFAYDSLQDTLELIPFRAPIPAPEPAAQPAAPMPTQLPPVMPESTRGFVVYRNGQEITVGNAKSL